VPGSVFVFNCYNETVGQLSVAGYSAGSITAWGNSGNTIYQPQSIAVARIAQNESRTAAQFAFGDNPCRIDWDSFSATFTVAIPDPSSGVSLDDDLILYAAVNQTILLNSRGSVLATFNNSMSSQ
jgi:hypothetical protein